MRKDEDGEVCPETLGEYRDLCAVLGGEDCRAVALLDERIATEGRDEKVIVSDQQMRILLMPLLIERKEPVKEDAHGSDQS